MMKFSVLAVVPITLMLCSSAQAGECFPECRDGYLCHEGTCIEACNPPCGEGKQCTADGQCVRDIESGTRVSTSPEVVAPIPDGTLIFFGVGPVLGEFYGGTTELEIDLRSLAFQVEIGGGINDDGYPCYHGGVFVGKRKFYDSSTSTRWTLLVGGTAGYLNEDDEYEYLLFGTKVMTGYTTFSPNGGAWGIDFGIKLGYRMQITDDEYDEDYSGLSGGFEARYRFGF